jgi:hypothetical protein
VFRRASSRTGEGCVERRRARLATPDRGDSRPSAPLPRPYCYRGDRRYPLPQDPLTGFPTGRTRGAAADRARESCRAPRARPSRFVRESGFTLLLLHFAGLWVAPTEARSTLALAPPLRGSREARRTTFPKNAMAGAVTLFGGLRMVGDALRMPQACRRTRPACQMRPR